MAYSRGITWENKNHPNFDYIITRVFLNHSKSQIDDLELVMDVFFKTFLRKYFTFYHFSNDGEKLEKQIDNLVDDLGNIKTDIPFERIVKGEVHSVKVKLMNALFKFKRIGDGLAFSLLSGKNFQSEEGHEKGNKTLKTMFQNHRLSLHEFFYSSKILIPIKYKQGVNNSVVVDMNDFYFRLKDTCRFFKSIEIGEFIERLVKNYHSVDYGSSGALLSVMCGGGIEIYGKFHHSEKDEMHNNLTWRKGNLEWKKGSSDLFFNESSNIRFCFEVKNPFADFNIFKEDIISDFESDTIHTLKEVSSILYVQLAAMNLLRNLD